MPKVSTNFNLDADLTIAITISLKQTRHVQGIPFSISRENSNAETIAALNEYEEMKNNPAKYKRYSSFKSARNEVLNDA